MVLLKQVEKRLRDRVKEKFTFQYGSIKTTKSKALHNIPLDLHSSMVLLKL